MKGFYQSHQDDGRISYRVGHNFYFPAHFHKKLEILILFEGNYTVTHNGTLYELKGGDIVIFDSYDIHAYERPASLQTKGLVLILPTWAVEKFCTRKNGKKIINPVISNAKLCKQVYNLGINYVIPDETATTVKSSTAELIMALIEREIQYSERKSSDETTLVQNILIYLNDNFKEQISLTTLSKKFGYSPEHVSRAFHRYLNIGLPDYVNKLRLEYIKSALATGNKKKITDLLFEAGFNSIQTYYRAKHKFKDN